jgi:hypothetical protein
MPVETPQDEALLAEASSQLRVSEEKPAHPGNARPVAKHRGIGRDIFITAIVSVLFVVALEVSLRLTGTHFDASLFQLDPVRNYSFRPGAKGWHTDENDIYVRINSNGNRDREHAVAAAPGTIRIAVLGSSMTAALQVEQQQTYTALLEKKLSRPGVPVEVMNFACAGYGPAQDFYTLRDQVWKFSPDIVIDEISLKQYVMNGTQETAMTKIPYPYFSLTPTSVTPNPGSEGVPRPTPREIARSNQFREVTNASQLFLLASTARKKLPGEISKILGTHTSTTSANDPRTDPWHWTLEPPPSPAVETGWQILERLTLLMNNEATAHHADFWVVISDDEVQTNPDRRVGEKLARELGVGDLMYGNNRFNSFLAVHRVNHIDLEPPLLAYVQRTGAFLHGGPKMPPGVGHWSVLGHEVVSDILAEKLAARVAELHASLSQGHDAAALAR